MRLTKEELEERLNEKVGEIRNLLRQAGAYDNAEHQVYCSCTIIDEVEGYQTIRCEVDNKVIANCTNFFKVYEED